MDTIFVSSQMKSSPINFVETFPIVLKGCKKLYLLGYAFKDLVASATNKGAIIVEILPFRFTWVVANGIGEGRLILPSKEGVSEHWFDTPLLVVDASRGTLPPLKDLQIRVFQAYGTGSTTAVANLQYLHLWFGFERA